MTHQETITSGAVRPLASVADGSLAVGPGRIVGDAMGAFVSLRGEAALARMMHGDMTRKPQLPPGKPQNTGTSTPVLQSIADMEERRKRVMALLSDRGMTAREVFAEVGGSFRAIQRDLSSLKKIGRATCVRIGGRYEWRAAVGG